MRRLWLVALAALVCASCAVAESPGGQLAAGGNGLPTAGNAAIKGLADAARTAFWWFVLGLVPLLAGAWLIRRTGMGLLAPWAARGRLS